jgi:phospholipid transport system transporter-binding protein
MKQGTEAIAASEPVFDLAAVSDVDSSGLAVVFAWVRAAQARGRSIRIANPPQNLLSLAEVYGVAELLPLA